ncbi:MAG: uncharacterized membrane-anchored protein YhcB (DUF1043 family) [Flavobacteriales bacterium]|jgi:uncharacterized membrane-anchored protein YhcB (DUF1043 family)
MDWLVGLLLLLVGGIIGFFVTKFFNQKNTSTLDKVASEQTIQELMNQQAVNHVQETRQIADNLIAQSASLKQRVEDYEQLLISQQTGPEGSLNYFGEHATAYLRNKSTKPTREKSSAGTQPLDFSSQSSGLFSGTEKSPVKETK